MAEANNSQPVGKVIVLTGHATAQSSGQERVLEVGSPVYKNDVLNTDSGSKLQVRFIDDTQVSQDESSSLRIDSFVYNPDPEDNSDLLLNLMKGTFRTISGEITKDSPTHFMLKSPQGTIGIRGTIIVSHVTDLFEKHGVEELTPGKIVVVSDDFGNIRIFKVPMQMVEFYQGKPVSEVRELLLNELDEFQLKAPLDLDKAGDGETPLGYTAPGNFLGGVDITNVDMIPSDFGLMGNLIFQFNSGVGLLGIFDSLSDVPGYDDNVRSGEGDDPLSDNKGELDLVPDPDSSDYTISAAETSQDESNIESSVTYTFTVTRSGDTTDEQTLGWTVAGTGANPADADDFGGELPSGTVTFAAGETEIEITVNVVGDDTTEADETFTIQLIDPETGEIISAPTVEATILNDDVAPEEIKIDGLAAGDNSGRSVSNAGDVNGDGFDDFIIGAPGADGSAGQTYVVYGDPGFTGAIDLSTLDGSNGFRLDGIDAGDQSGISVSNAGDINGDGYSDLIIGARGADGFTGQSYVVFGGAELPGSVDLSALDGSNGFKIDGINPSGRNGTSVSSAGDVNGDGFDDIIVGAPGVNGFTGESYVVFGASDFPESVNLEKFYGFRLSGSDTGDNSGYSVAGAGDVNGDGYDDLIVGADGADPDDNSSAGETYVVYGGPEGSDINFSDFYEFRIDGIEAGDRSGYSVESAGDVNGDGFNDILVGAPGANGSAGEAYVIFGADRSSDINLSDLDGANGFSLSDQNEGDRLGTSVSRAGDVNGDGFDDIIVGAPGADGSAGEAYVVFGAPSEDWSTDFDLSTLDGTNGFAIPGLNTDDYSGVSVSAAGDINGDGFDDLIVGAYYADPGALSDAGESYIIFGQDYSGVVTHQGTVGGDSFTGSSSADIMIGGLGNDTLEGEGGSDVLYGGAGNDILALAGLNFFRVDGGRNGELVNGGEDTLRLDGLELDLTSMANNKIQGIERIDLIAGGAENHLTLNISDVLDMSDTTNILFIDGGGDDSITLSDSRSWTAGDSFSDGGEIYQTYYNGAATLHVDIDIDGLPPVSAPEALL